MAFALFGQFMFGCMIVGSLAGGAVGANSASKNYCGLVDQLGKLQELYDDTNQQWNNIIYGEASLEQEIEGALNANYTQILHNQTLLQAIHQSYIRNMMLSEMAIGFIFIILIFAFIIKYETALRLHKKKQ